MTDSSGTPQAETIVEVFCVYAQKDEPLQRALKMHIDNTDYEKYKLKWRERLVEPGVDWTQEFDPQINSTQLVLLLISIDFLDSRYSYGRELARALERHRAGEVRIIPIILRAVHWQNQPFANLQVLPREARPISAWEDKDKVFSEIARALLKTLRVREAARDKPPQSSYVRRPSHIWQTPLALNPLFTEHDQQLTSIFAQLLLNQGVAISGPSGSGKSQLAAEYIYRHCQQYRAILWVDAGTPQALNASYAKLAALLSGQREHDEQGVNAQMVKAWLATSKNWLLILDKLDNPALLFPGDEAEQPHQTSPFLPATLHGHLLITTSAPDMSSLNQVLARPLAMIPFVAG